MRLRKILTFRQFVVITGGTSLVIAAIVAFWPSLLPKSVHQGITVVFTQYDEEAVLLTLAVILAFYGLMTPWAGRRRDHQNLLEDLDWERPGRDASVAGYRLTKTIEARIGSTDPSPDPIRPRKRLRGLLISVYSRKLGSRDAAIEYVDDGEWTANRIAAAYLSDKVSVEYPLPHRLYAWLYPGRAFGRQVTHALAEIESACDDRLVSYESPDDHWEWGTSLIGRLRLLLAVIGERQ